MHQPRHQIQKHFARTEDTLPAVATAAIDLQRIAADIRLPPHVRAGASRLGASLESMLSEACARRKAVEQILGEITVEYDVHDIRWVERRQRSTDQPLHQILHERFARTAAKALRKAAEAVPQGHDYLTAAKKLADGEWHYLDLLPYLDQAPFDLNMSEIRARALERSTRRLRTLWQYMEAVSAAE